MHHHDPIVIHQDIKPQNVLVSQATVYLYWVPFSWWCHNYYFVQITHDIKGVFLCDMGVTKLKQAALATLTSVTKGPGTYPYMAPKMFKPAKRVCPVDIYSVGCLYLELFTRRRVWPGLDSTEIMMKMCGTYNTPPTMPDTSDLKGVPFEICSRCLLEDQTQRPTITEVLSMLKKLEN